MLLIQETFLIADDIVREQFICNLDACKGACCWEGDAGAPLDDDEVTTLERIYPALKPFLSAAGLAELERQGRAIEFVDRDNGEIFMGTPLINGGPCAYLTKDGNGLASCGIELAWKAGAVDFRKPISCHLYPIRVEKSKNSNMVMLNYDRWDICSAACTKGKEHHVPVYQFLKEPLERAYGTEFYEELDAAAAYLLEH
jgi:Fe-S-cluster containining protein